jgi:L-Ala-D/L-Glu epimerase
MDLSFETLDLKLHFPFTISRGTQLIADNVQIRLSDGDFTGLGEAAPAEHYGETQGSVLAFLERLRPHLAQFPSLPIHTLHQIMDETVRLNPAAKAAVDMALYDLLGRRLGVPVYTILGLDPLCTPRTSYTIGIDAPDVMAQKAAEARDCPILKVKVGTSNDHANLQAIRDARPDAILRVDANEAWTPKEAVKRIEELLPYDLEFVEQPVAAHDLQGLGYVRQSVSLPVLVDESCVVPADVPRVAPYVDGINIKLMKCGGIYPALQMVHLARAHNLKIMLGCMVESSIAITAAAHLSPLVDYGDLDGNLLIEDDPQRGSTVVNGKLVPPEGPGLGLQPAR